MGISIVLGAVLLIIILVIKAGSTGVNGGLTGTTASDWFDDLLANGIAARGILLSVSSTAARAITPSYSMRRFECRYVTMDVEIPGQAPYVIDVTPFIPTNLARDVLPGATVELRIDPSDNSRIAIVGPGAGFSVAALNAGTMPDQRLP